MDKNFEELCGTFFYGYQEFRGSYLLPERSIQLLWGIRMPLFTEMKALVIPIFLALGNYPYAKVRDWARTFLKVTR